MNVFQFLVTEFQKFHLGKFFPCLCHGFNFCDFILILFMNKSRFLLQVCDITLMFFKLCFFINRFYFQLMCMLHLLFDFIILRNNGVDNCDFFSFILNRSIIILLSLRTCSCFCFLEIRNLSLYFSNGIFLFFILILDIF